MVQEPKNNEINTKLPPKMLMRKPSSRQKSITRGTASSLAKSVYAQQQPPPPPEDHKKRPCTIRKKHDTPNKTRSYKFPLKTMNDDDASPTAGLGSFSDDSPDISADESVNSRRLSDSTLIETLFDHHHHQCHVVEDNIPSYMRRPICAACNRNVKVNSESKQSTDSSRRSSFSSLKSDHLKRRYDHSPSTSPIPTRRTQKEKWSELLLQQHQLISMIALEDPYDIQDKLNHHEQYETILIETQAKILQKLTAMVEEKEKSSSSSRFGRFSQWIGTMMGDDIEFDYDPDHIPEETQNLVDILERPW